MTERIKRIPSDYEILENGNDYKSRKPGLKNCNKIEAYYVSHTQIKRNSYRLLFNTTEDAPIDFNISIGKKFRLYQNVVTSTEDVIAKILKIRKRTNTWIIDVKIESGNIEFSTTGDLIVFNLNLIYSTETKYKTVTNVFATNVKTDSAFIKWTNPDSKDVQGYAIQFRKINDTSNVNWTRKEIVSADDAFIYLLVSNSKYEVQVMVIYTGGYSIFSEPFIFKTL